MAVMESLGTSKKSSKRQDATTYIRAFQNDDSNGAGATLAAKNCDVYYYVAICALIGLVWL